ncbi:PilW family protein [Spongiibacter sp. KMU-158]|uniref:PilW family protein n=1 Tax=Spongiibacter pelagi TaxID=2760804 RepID=A0A927BZZ6_9GAMM|nr:PilW family protein [Spongiibacter pelagi]MBD2858719.1 PilW family protein [Spongiibacter pelagi]
MKSVKGFGLVELMISMTIGVLLTLAVSQVLIASRVSDNVQDALSQNQENARFSMHFIGKELRMAGYLGCNTLANIEASSIALPDSEADFTRGSSLIVENNVGDENAFDAVNETDVLRIKRGSNNSIRITGDLAADLSSIRVEDNSAGFKQGDFLVVSDCERADVFRVTNTPKAAGEGETKFTYEQGALNSDNRLSNTYGEDSEVFALENLDFFIRDSGRKTHRGSAINSLYVQRRLAGSAGVTGQAIELLEGVEDMQLELGVDNNGDRAVDEYLSADDVADWERVLSVKVRLQMVSSNSAAVNGAGQNFISAAGESLDVSDGRMRRVYTNVFSIRNTLP